MARPMKPLVRSGGYYPSNRWIPLVYPGGYTTMNSGGEPTPSVVSEVDPVELSVEYAQPESGGS